MPPGSSLLVSRFPHRPPVIGEGASSPRGRDISRRKQQKAKGEAAELAPPAHSQLRAHRGGAQTRPSQGVRTQAGLCVLLPPPHSQQKGLPTRSSHSAARSLAPASTAACHRDPEKEKVTHSGSCCWVGSKPESNCCGAADAKGSSSGGRGRLSSLGWPGRFAGLDPGGSVDPFPRAGGALRAAPPFFASSHPEACFRSGLGPGADRRPRVLFLPALDRGSALRAGSDAGVGKGHRARAAGHCRRFLLRFARRLDPESERPTGMFSLPRSWAAAKEELERGAWKDHV